MANNADGSEIDSGLPHLHWIRDRHCFPGEVAVRVVRGGSLLSASASFVDDSADAGVVQHEVRHDFPLTV